MDAGTTARVCPASGLLIAVPSGCFHSESVSWSYITSASSASFPEVPNVNT